MGLEPKGALDPYSQPLLIKIFRKTYSNQMIQIFLAFKMKITTAFSLHASSTRGSCKRATGGHQSFHKVDFQSLNPRDAPGTNASHGHGGVSAMTGALPVRVTCTMAPLPPKATCSHNLIPSNTHDLGKESFPGNITEKSPSTHFRTKGARPDIWRKALWVPHSWENTYSH